MDTNVCDVIFKLAFYRKLPEGKWKLLKPCLKAGPQLWRRRVEHSPWRRQDRGWQVRQKLHHGLKKIGFQCNDGVVYIRKSRYFKNYYTNLVLHNEAEMNEWELSGTYFREFRLVRNTQRRKSRTNPGNGSSWHRDHSGMKKEHCKKIIFIP